MININIYECRDCATEYEEGRRGYIKYQMDGSNVWYKMNTRVMPTDKITIVDSVCRYHMRKKARK